jgi:3-polyprenyl-4-hydroxybenzoate decarboxylase
MLAKIISYFVGLVGAVSAIFAMVSLRKMQKKEAQVELLKARQDSQIKIKEEKQRIEKEIETAVKPIEKLTDSKEDRQSLASLLDE